MKYIIIFAAMLCLPVTLFCVHGPQCSNQDSESNKISLMAALSNYIKEAQNKPKPSEKKNRLQKISDLKKLNKNLAKLYEEKEKNLN